MAGAMGVGWWRSESTSQETLAPVTVASEVVEVYKNPQAYQTLAFSAAGESQVFANHSAVAEP